MTTKQVTFLFEYDELMMLLATQRLAMFTNFL